MDERRARRRNRIGRRWRRPQGTELRGLAEVAVVQAADFGKLQDLSRRRRLDGPEVGGVLVEREVSARLMIVAEVAGQDSMEVSLTENEYRFVLVVLSHDRRRLVHFNVTEHPTAGWTARQLVEACALEETPGNLIRDRDQVYGERFSRQARALNIREVVIAPRSPWQNAYAERVIGSIRRECLDHLVVIGERHLKRLLSEYVHYDNTTRTHLSVAKDAPEPRSVQPPSQGRVVEMPRVGGLHHEYLRRAA